MPIVSLAALLESLETYLANQPWAPLYSAPWLGTRELVTLAYLLITKLILSLKGPLCSLPSPRSLR